MPLKKKILMETCYSWVRYMFTCIVRRWHSCGTLPVPEVHASQQKSWGIAHGRDRPQSPEQREDALHVGLVLSLLRLMVTLASAPRAPYRPCIKEESDTLLRRHSAKDPS